jgi:hypothetical protein
MQILVPLPAVSSGPSLGTSQHQWTSTHLAMVGLQPSIYLILIALRLGAMQAKLISGLFGTA